MNRLIVKLFGVFTLVYFVLYFAYQVYVNSTFFVNYPEYTPNYILLIGAWAFVYYWLFLLLFLAYRCVAFGFKRLSIDKS